MRGFVLLIAWIAVIYGVGYSTLMVDRDMTDKRLKAIEACSKLNMVAVIKDNRYICIEGREILNEQ